VRRKAENKETKEMRGMTRDKNRAVPGSRVRR